MDLAVSFIVPVMLIIMIAGFKVRGDIAGIIGWVVLVALAAFYFETAIDIALIASVKGALASMAITAMGFFALLQITMMQETGALQRIVVFIKGLSPEDKTCQVMIINVILGTALVAVGATPAIVLPPIMFALGYSLTLSIALPCIGYDSLCTFAMLSAAVVTMSDILTGAGFTMSDGSAPTIEVCAAYFANFLPVVTPCICASMMVMMGGFKALAKGIVPVLITGLGMGGTAWITTHLGIGVPLTGVMAAAVTFCLMMIYMKMRGLKLYDNSGLSAEDKEVENSMSLLQALSPWIILIATNCIVNFVPPLYAFLSKTLEFRIFLYPGDSGQAMRFFWQAYFWVLVSTIVSSFIIPHEKGMWGNVISKWMKRWAPPTISSLVYFMIAYVMMFSAYTATGTTADGQAGAWELVNADKNIISIWALAAADAFGWFYPIANGFLGLVAGFVTGSEASTVALFAKYNLLSAEVLGVNPVVVIAGGGVAAGLASVVTPVKLQQAAASLDKVGEESSVLRLVLPYAVVLVCVAVILAQIFAITIQA